MIRFFRTIRKKIIASGSITKYLLYATGEILLVVIGILIALQVNNWNEERKNRGEEIFFLEKLVSNLEADSLTANNLLVYMYDMESKIDSSLYMMAHPEAFDSRRFTTYINMMLGTTSINLNRATYDNLLSSGKISLIMNQQIVDALFDYYDPASGHLSWAEAQKKYTRNHFGPLLMEVDYIVPVLDSGISNSNYEKLEKPDHPFSYYRENQLLLNYLNLKYYINNGYIENIEEELLPKLAETLFLIRQELQNNYAHK